MMDVMFVYMIFLGLIHTAFLATIIKGKDVHVFASYENLTLTCEYESISSIPSSDLVKLKFYDKDDVNFGMERGFMHSHRFLSANKISSVLIKHMVDSFDAGTYICKFNNDNSKRFKTEVVIVHFTTIGDDYDNIAGERQPNKLQCNYIVQKESFLNAQSKVMWKMGDKAAESLSDRHKVNGTVLTIVNTAWTDVGPYTCVVTVSWGGTSNPDNAESVTSIVPLRGAPKLGKMDTSKNVVLGDDLEITCDVSGYPYPTVNWFKDGKPLMSDKRITLSDNGVYRKAILGINNLEFEDKGEYTCTATSPENPLGVTATIDISVKAETLSTSHETGVIAGSIIGTLVLLTTAIVLVYFARRHNKCTCKKRSEENIRNNPKQSSDLVEEILVTQPLQVSREN
uniref:Hemicentin-1-like isoform X2 n=1 Tax=Crassostrea virginica TaxID=6565 RepID=A0A8B8DL39_CRAVI|nr:hemicentin-1-like isoform X2 [Crassostrea virginica]